MNLPAFKMKDDLEKNIDFLQNIFLAQKQGRNCLPDNLGLAESEYRIVLNLVANDQKARPVKSETGQLRQELLELRAEEVKDIIQLLISQRAQNSSLEILFSKILGAGCLGSSHLWKDLGLPSREDLRVLLEINFPALAASNIKNMRWKKFFYKQLCEQEGSYVCRSPSCEQCSTYQECFGEEI